MKISVIVPVYNAAKFLDKCINSVREQTYMNWELILVDDGSQDESGDIIDIFAKKESRIKAIHQTNAGPGEARNRGIDEAKGDYVVFLDSDDYIDKEYFELLASKAENHDLVFIDVLQVSDKGKLLAIESMSKYQGWTKDRLLRSQLTGKIPWGGVRKAVKLDLLRNNMIKYTTHAIGEEALYSFRILHAAQEIGFIDEKPVYYYVNHSGSQSKIVMDDPWGLVAQNLKAYLKEKELYNIYANTINAFQFVAAVVSLDKIAQTYSGREQRQKAKGRVVQLIQQYDKTARIDFKNMSTKAKVFVPILKIGAYKPVLIVSDIRLALRKYLMKNRIDI